jgi:hypothetical protein
LGLLEGTGSLLGSASTLKLSLQMMLIAGLQIFRKGQQYYDWYDVAMQIKPQCLITLLLLY